MYINSPSPNMFASIFHIMLKLCYMNNSNQNINKTLFHMHSMCIVHVQMFISIQCVLYMYRCLFPFNVYCACTDVLFPFNVYCACTDVCFHSVCIVRVQMFVSIQCVLCVYRCLFPFNSIQCSLINPICTITFTVYKTLHEYIWYKKSNK